MRILGVDPGLSGGLVILEDGRIFKKIIAPVIAGNKRNEYDIVKLIAFIRDNGVTHAILEKSTTRPLQSAQSTFTTGKGFGMYYGILATLGIQYMLVSPQAWQKEVLAGCPKGESKQYAMLFCQRMWPKEDWRASERCKNLHDGLTDSAAMAFYGSKHFAVPGGV